MRYLSVVQAPAPPPPFTEVTIVIKSKAQLANLLGALVAYGTGKVYAEESLKAIGLGDFYSGNVRKASRETALAIAEASNVVPLPEFAAYIASQTFKSSHPSTAGAAVLGTDQDLAVGRSKTYFETPAVVEESFDDGDESEDENDYAVA
jgi:hypothetical protein